MSGRCAESFCRLFLLLLAMLFMLPSRGDEIWLINGDLLRGTIMELKEGQVDFDTVWAGRIKVDLSHIQSLETEDMLWVRIRGQDEFRLVRLYSLGEQTWLRDQQGNSIPLNSQNSLVALRPDHPGQNQWLVSGTINGNVSLKRGDSNKNQVKTFGTVNVRDRVNRNILKWDSKYTKDNNELDDKELKLTYDYNRFLDHSWYVLGSGLWSYDIDGSPYMRSSVGAGIGYEFWDRGTGSLKSDIALSRLWEYYRTQDTRRRWAIRWGVNGSQQITGGLSATADSAVFYRLGEGRQSLWDLDLGLKYHVSSSFWLNLRYSLDYNSQPKDDSAACKKSVSFGLGAFMVFEVKESRQSVPPAQRCSLSPLQDFSGNLQKARRKHYPLRPGCNPSGGRNDHVCRHGSSAPASGQSSGLSVHKR